MLKASTLYRVLTNSKSCFPGNWTETLHLDIRYSTWSSSYQSRFSLPDPTHNKAFNESRRLQLTSSLGEGKHVLGKK